MTIGAAVYDTNVQVFATGVWTVVDFTSERYDTDSFHDNGINPSRFTIPTGLQGKYLFGGNIGVQLVADNKNYQIGLYHNGTRVAESAHWDGAVSRYVSIVSEVNVLVGDYLQIAAYQDSTATDQNSDNTEAYSLEFWLQKIQ